LQHHNLYELDLEKQHNCLKILEISKYEQNQSSTIISELTHTNLIFINLDSCNIKVSLFLSIW
jgi:hypothetical protein